MSLKKGSFHGDPNIGLFAFATDKYLFAADDSIHADNLNVPVVASTISGTQLCGMFAAGNSHGIILPVMADKLEIKRISTQMKKLGVNVLCLDSKQNAMGNVILCNDTGALASPELKPFKKKIEACLKVPVTFGKLLDMDIVGSVCLATNKGFLLNMHAGDEDFEFVKKVLGTEGDIGTINFGGQFVRSGLVANSSGAIAGSRTSGPELSRIEESLGFI